MSSDKKVVLVTGASSGIGAAIAINFSEKGDKVVLVGRNERKLHSVSQRCKEIGGDTLIIIADLTIDADIKRLAPYGIRVNSVNPGPTKTDFMERLGFDDEKKRQFWNTLQKGTLLNQIIEPSEVADLVLFLASDKAKSITGSSFVIDSGASLKGLLEE
ncbi:unnamed protein product [Parnassius mnemosyne]|uniref:Uncharacterized protein n=1 Tax=Parnassius mnemosyne TaxID=213953 RepID=A0AAV1KW36_9NEOP